MLAKAKRHAVKVKPDAPEFETASEFEALSDAEKERIYQELDTERPEDRMARSTPLDAHDRERHRKFMRIGGRPKLGKNGVKVIALSVEKELLKRTDAYAKAQGLNRSELVSQALLKLLPKAG